MTYKKLVMPIFILSLLSSAGLAQASQEGHYMMGSGESHQGHEMDGREHIGGSVSHNEIFEPDHSSRTKTARGYIMIGGEGDQSDWRGSREKFDDGHDHKMKGGAI